MFLLDPRAHVRKFAGRAFIDIGNLMRNTGKVCLSDVQLTLQDIMHGDSCAGSGGMSSSRGRVKLQSAS